MKRLLFLVPFVILATPLFSQLKIKNKKYPSLFWEITGKGLKKPSYLFGTMHVSNKIAFHLSDSFYLGIRQADVVALETNPESWQEDMSNYDVEDYGYNEMSGFSESDDSPNDYLTIQSLKFTKYEKFLEAALFREPAVINNLLYRSYSDKGSDFEEDTYLDMYIYQVGKKLGKRIAGVEDYAESMRLMMEAYRDAAREKNRKEKSYDYDIELSPMQLQEAYRSGNLDLLDSINKLNSYSEAFDEKFLYKRNELQANSIDSILKRSTLFVGVGAAHLPGPRGVIELLRAKGYRLRPIMMGTRDSRHKDQVEKLRVNVNFSTQVSPDGFYKVEIPGKFYDFSEFDMLDQRQYADMANGSYYMVTRVRTNALFWGHSPQMIAKKIDSVLYENVPGKILSKLPISRNGYNGFDITNKTRRGDYQRYNIFITPYEVIFFKMSGNSDYVITGSEAKKFFGSIQLSELKNGGWKKFQPSFGGFAVELPQEPVMAFSGNVQWDAYDKLSGTHFTILRTDVHNYNFAEEDTFDLSLMEESFSSSEFIDKPVSRKFNVYKGYPALDCRYRHKNGSVFDVRYLIQGPFYYTLIAHGTSENTVKARFLNSFEIKPFEYGGLEERLDTLMKYSVRTTWFPVQKKTKLELPADDNMESEDDDDDVFSSLRNPEHMRSRLISNDTTGERIFIIHFRSPEYFYFKDSINFDMYKGKFNRGIDSSWITRSVVSERRSGNMLVSDIIISDTNSSRQVRMKSFYRNGVGYTVLTQSDTLTSPSSFVKSFFDSFSPMDSMKGFDIHQKKAKKYFKDLFSQDSSLRKKAIKWIGILEVDSTDFLSIKKAIESFNWSEKKYLETKKAFIQKLGEIDSRQSTDYLKKLYFAAGDTVELQYASLETMLRQKTSYAFSQFKDIMISEPPVLGVYGMSSSVMMPTVYGRYPRGFQNNSFIDELYDSLALTHQIIQDLMPLMNLDDYERPLMRLLKELVDSNMVKPESYNIYFSKFLIEAKQELKKQAIEEKKISIEKARENLNEGKNYGYSDSKMDVGNEDLNTYATLLLPFWDSNPNVKPLFQQLLASNDKRLKYNTAILLLRNNKAVPDTLWSYFASNDDYRYLLYKDLMELKKMEKYPVKFNDHKLLGKSRLLEMRQYSSPDTIQYIDRSEISYKGRKGFIYFYKYKLKKDDVSWKIATVGLVPEDPKKFLFDGMPQQSRFTLAIPGMFNRFDRNEDFNFTAFREYKINEDEPLKDQLNKELRKMIVSKRKSARLFYQAYGGGDYDYVTEVTMEE